MTQPSKTVLTSAQRASADRAINKALLNAWRCRADKEKQS